MNSRKLMIVSGIWGLTFFFLNCSSPVKPATITLDPAETYQTITGWEATAQAGQEESPNFQNYANHLFDLAVNDLGINRLRVEIYSGTENSRDSWSDFRSGRITSRDLRSLRYSTINDNADPFLINPEGFHFEQLDLTIDQVVLPFKKIVESRKERFFFNVNYVAFTKQIGGGLEYIHDRPEEYAEFVLATYLHLKRKYNLIPDAWEIILEPDNVRQWNGKLMGEAIVAAAKRLKNEGFNPKFIAPSTTSMTNAITYFDALMKVPGTGPYVTEISYHRYRNVSLSNLQSISDRAQRYGFNTAMLEHIGSGYEDLHEDLTVGRNSAWQQYTLAFPGTSANDDGGRYYTIDESAAGNPEVLIASRTKFLRQYFKYVRPGARRVAASSDAKQFDPVAFVNTSGGFVVIVKASAGGPFSIHGMPSGTYGIKYTTSHHYDMDLNDVKVSGAPLQASIPDSGVISVFRR